MQYQPFNGLIWNEAGMPYSPDFGDIYFSTEDGLAETEYVFLMGNGLPEQWLTWENSQFTIAETGFGTGLNFLATWKLFDAFSPKFSHNKFNKLHFISYEQYPLSRTILEQTHAHWPELLPYSTLLQQQWPTMFDTQQIIHLSEHVSLELRIGEINKLIQTNTVLVMSTIDCWFLDGFSPAKNPLMWTPALFHFMAQHSHHMTTFATFTSSGIVRRGLLDAGFHVEKRKGYGKKREMLTGYYVDKAHEQR